jgi:PadR family transcriptional regulator, regulatory protein PadR
MRLNAFASFVEFHVLHHASEESVYGLWLIEELAEHGYKISPGTLYPLLHAMESAGLLKSRNTIFKGKVRKYYSITPKGKRYLQRAKRQVGELVREVFSEQDYRQFLHMKSGK